MTSKLLAARRIFGRFISSRLRRLVLIASVLSFLLVGLNALVPVIAFFAGAFVAGLSCLYDWCKFKTLELPLDSAVVRKVVTGIVPLKGKSAQNHSHGDSARDRNLALPYARFLSEMLGMPIYVYQQSRSNQAVGVAGSREFFWYRDLVCQPIDYDPPRDSILVIIDTDYYLDHDELARLLHSVDGPVLIATFIPVEAARSNGDNGYCFCSDQTVLNEISGGARFSHRLWDWSPDTLFFEWDGVKTVYDVDRVKIGTSGTYNLVALTPSVRYVGYPVWSPDFLVEIWMRLTRGVKTLGGRRLEHLSPVVNDVVYIESQRTDGRYVSLARVGSFTSITVPYDQFTYIMNVIKLGKVSPSIGIVASATKLELTEASVMLGCCLLLSGARPAYVTSGIDVYHAQWGQLDDTAKPSLHPFMSQIIPDSVIFDGSVGNEAKGVAGRVVGVRRDDIELDAGVFNFMVEYIGLLIPTHEQHSLSPTTLEDVAARRKRPTQRAVDRREELDVVTKVRPAPFVKAEAYEIGADDKVTDPRMITPAGSKSCREYARFVHALDPLFSRIQFVGPGHSPRELADEVVRICMLSKGIALTDFSRLDGRISFVTRYLWQMFMMTAFGRCHHKALLKCIRENFMQMAKTSGGIDYCTGWARWSGSMETTWANTLVTGFFAFIGLRHMGYDGETALGMFNATGDDLICADLTEAAATWAAKKLNLVVEYSWVPFGGLGVNYLNQWFGYGAYYGDNNSISKVDRALRKFHLGPRLVDVSANDYAATKGAAYLLSNPETPILSEFCRTLVKFGNKKDISVGAFFAENFDRDVQFPNFRADWQYEYLEMWMPEFDYNAFRAWMLNCDAKTVLMVPLCMPSKYNGLAKTWINGDSVVPAVIENLPVDVHENDYYADRERRVRMQRIADALCAVDASVDAPISHAETRLQQIVREAGGGLQPFDFGGEYDPVFNSGGTPQDLRFVATKRASICNEPLPTVAEDVDFVSQYAGACFPTATVDAPSDVPTNCTAVAAPVSIGDADGGHAASHSVPVVPRKHRRKWYHK